MKVNTRLTESLKNSAARRLRGGVASALILLLVLAAAAATGRADSEQLDPTFGFRGKVTTDFFESSDEANDLVIQPDGKIVAVGTASTRTVAQEFFALARYNADGSRDSSFGTGGRVTTDFNSFQDVASAVALQADGKIVVAGTTYFSEYNGSGETPSDFALARYNADGSLDPTFGTGGRVTTDFVGRPNTAADMLIQPDGKIVVVGRSRGVFLMRYNSNGTPDTTFAGALGGVIVDYRSSSDRAEGVALQPDGKLVVAGASLRPSGNGFDFIVTRFNPDGRLDRTFHEGYVIVDFSAEGAITSGANAVAVQPDGKIVVAGFANSTSNLIPSGSGEALARLNPDGSLDPTFGVGGKVLTQDFFGASARATDLVLQSDGRIVVAGSAGTRNTSGTFNFAVTFDFTASRYNADGTLDQTFGSGGKLKTDFFGSSDIASAVALQPDGKIVVAGGAGVDLPRDFALVRYNASAAQSPTLVQFSSATYLGFESDSGSGSNPARIFVTRTGDTGGTTTVFYSTADGSATQKSDYTLALGSFTFAPGETSKFFDVLLTQEGFARNGKVAHLLLSDPSGAGIGPRGSAELYIGDDDSRDSQRNPIDDPRPFVSQHYHDFLNREPDQAGFAFWHDPLEHCSADQSCRETRRLNISAAFFLSIEFQETGFYAIRLQRVAFGRKSEAAATRLPYRQFIHDARQLGEGVVVGQAGYEQSIEDNRQAYAERVVSGPEFGARFPASLTAAQYADALYSSAGVTPTEAERGDAVAAFGAGGPAGRVAALRKVAESASVRNAEFNAAFVLTQYFGYLRRNPTDAPDVDDTGYQFWLAKLNQFRGNFQNAEMVKAFIDSDEFRHRFGH